MDQTPQEIILADILTAARKLLTIMEVRNLTEVGSVFAARDVVILDSFYPYMFSGADAAHTWMKGFQLHACNLADLRASIGAYQEFSTQDGMAFISLPVVWEGMSNGVPFHETGGLALRFIHSQDGWKIQNYGWAATEYVTKG